MRLRQRTEEEALLRLTAPRCAVCVPSAAVPPPPAEPPSGIVTPVPTPDAPSPRRHSVFGRVVASDGQALPEAEVFWVDAAHAGEASVDLIDVHKVAHADREGRFWAPQLPEGTHYLLADFRRLGVDGDQVDIAHAQAVTVPLADDEEVTLRFPFERREFGSIHVVVRHEGTHRPGSRLPIGLLTADGERMVRQGETHTNGKIAFEFLKEGRYRLTLAGTRTRLEGTAELELGRNARLDVTVDQRTRPPGTRTDVAVHVTDHLGLPAIGALVQLVAPGFHHAPVRTDREGVAPFPALPVLPQGVIATLSGHHASGAALPKTEPGTPIAIHHRLLRAARLRVRVRDATDGRTLRHANVLVSHAGGDHWTWGGVLPPPDAPPREAVEMEVPLGDTTVRATSPGHRPGETQVTIDDADAVQEIVIDLKRARAV